MLAAGSAASLAALLIWLGPPGNDLAAHVYQRTVFLHHGFQLWNNFWYGGRYGFVNYSVLYYPLAAVFGIRALAILSIAIAALAFASSSAGSGVRSPAGRAGRSQSSGRGLVISAAFPFALGFALGLLAIWALQAGKALVVRGPRRPDGRREPARVPPAGDLPRGDRARDARARPEADRARGDRPLRRGLSVPAHARVRRRRPLPVLGVRAALHPDLLRARGAPHVARRVRARAPLVLHRLRRRQPRHVRLHDSARREHRARPARRAADRGARALAQALAPAAGRGARARARRDVEPQPARLGAFPQRDACTTDRAPSTGNRRRATCTST